jgi:HEAT repeat protein
VLQAIAATAVAGDPEECAELARAVLPHLESDDPLRAGAAASALGRLHARCALPALIAALEREEAPVARAALAALREISGTELTASPSLWKHWHAEEERWWRERAPALCARLERSPASAVPRAELVALLAELSEHALFRAELAPLVARVLEHDEPGLRALAARALERLGGPTATGDATVRAGPAPP